ncbi:carbohydrate-binding protein [Streptomyces sp. V4-01]|uniref:Carbohydrate-binding protein n=1 Tax=Actinacidiphila polyblastidii TaxID=3110430 RepID=A0ABU7PNI5_9ACTN|nr:carbohydrate-binding protein [Streptomyces sp. V4-01]
MTAGHDGTPENDDPFAYLYRSEGGEQPDPAGGQPTAPYQQPYGQPRTSYHQVQRVGERRSPQGGYGYPPQQQQQPPQQGYDQRQQQYGGGATQQYPQQPQGYDTPPPAGGGGGRRGGGQQPDTPNRKGLLIAAVAVVAAVAVGIAFAMTNGSGDKNDKAGGSTPTSAPATQTTPSDSPTPSATPSDFDSGPVDASTLTLAGGAAKSNQWTGADAAGGTYVDHMGSPGASALWTVTVPSDDDYTFFISYGNAGQDANLALTINGKPRTDQVNLKNYGQPPYTDWAKAWDNHTYAWVTLKKGANTIALTCLPGSNCGVNLDQVWLKQGQVTK